MISPTVTNTSLQFGLDPMDAAFEAFRQAYPAFDSTRKLDELRATEYARLDRQGHVYLDYTGGGLYAESQLREHMALLREGIFGNPHSKNLTSMAMTHLVEQARDYVLQYFNASPDEYMVIFTQNSTGALKLVGESYPFGPGDTYLLTFDNHNSVNGIREFARARGATVTYIPVVLPDLRVDDDQLAQALETARPGQNNLFAYPAQSNFTGVQHPLEWIALAQAEGLGCAAGCGLLCAFQPAGSQPLASRLRRYLVLQNLRLPHRHRAACWCAKPRRQKLRRPWYAGGTITFSSVVAFDHYLTPGPAGFEDGTVNYLSLPAVEIGLKYIESIGIDLIHTRVMCLTGWLIDRLLALRHSNGKPLIRLYGPPDTYHARRDGPGQFLRSGWQDYSTATMWRGWRMRSASRCARGVTVIRGRARSRWVSPRKTWRPVSGIKTA